MPYICPVIRNYLIIRKLRSYARRRATLSVFMPKRATAKVRLAFFRSLPPSSHIAKHFKMTDASIIAIRSGVGVYASQAQALLVAADVLSRLREPVKVPESLVAGKLTGRTYKLDPRTVRLLDALRTQYGTARRVMAACAYVISTAP
jgi:hypothetical protein